MQQDGIIKIVQPSGTVNAAAFLNIGTKITYGGERGLLGLAFHPNYATNGYFFVYYNQVTSGNIIVARYSVNPGNPDIADATTEKIILNIPKPFTNHNGGSINFAPDGNLWVSTGDGGSGGDPNNNGQNKNSLLGKMLRIDINATGPYNIPAGNPFIGVDGADEIWAFGQRNAWKFSFDLTAGNVMIADVGQNQIEEINKMPITQAGINYGWRCYEGNTAFNTTVGCPAMTTMTFPVAVYNHAGGRCSITGGYVYRGSAHPILQGKYLFTDYCLPQIGILNPDNQIVWSTSFAGNNFVTFGEDSSKELYIGDVANGKIFKISAPNLATNEASENSYKISPNPAFGKVFVDGLKTKNNTAEIINSEGRKILETPVNADKSVNISSLKTGVYFITILSENQKIFYQKLIVK